MLRTGVRARDYLRSLWPEAGGLHQVNTPNLRGSLKRTHFPLSDHDINVVVFARGVVGVAYSQRTGHPQVDQQSARFLRDCVGSPSSSSTSRYFARRQQRATRRPPGLVDFRRYGPAQAGVADDNFTDRMPGQERLDTPKGGFNFR